MVLSMETLLSSIVGFLLGCIITTLIAILFYHLQQKKLAKSAQLRHHVVSSVGRLCSSIENAFSSYRVGVMSYENLRGVLLDKIDQINTTLNSNIDILDSYYIKNIERFIVDQKCFLLHDEKDRPASTTGESRRGISRAILQDIDHVGKAEEPQPAAIKPPIATIPKGGIVVEEDLDKPAGTVVPEKPVDIEVLIPAKELKKEKEKIKPKEAKSPEPVKIDKKRPPEPVIPPPLPQQPLIEPVIPEPLLPEQQDARAEVLSAFEEGVTARFSLDTIKQYTEEPVEIKEEAILDTVAGIEETGKGEEPTPFIFEPLEEKKLPEAEIPLRKSADVDATQVFNIQDLLAKTNKREDKKASKERGREKPKPASVTPEVREESAAFFDVKIPKMTLPEKPAQEEKKDERDDDLITGDDVADQLDNIFGSRK